MFKKSCNVYCLFRSLWPSVPATNGRESSRMPKRVVSSSSNPESARHASIGARWRLHNVRRKDVLRRRSTWGEFHRASYFKYLKISLYETLHRSSNSPSNSLTELVCSEAYSLRSRDALFMFMFRQSGSYRLVILL
jgi:hypothetical protein